MSEKNVRERSNRVLEKARLDLEKAMRSNEKLSQFVRVDVVKFAIQHGFMEFVEARKECICHVSPVSPEYDIFASHYKAHPAAILDIKKYLDDACEHVEFFQLMYTLHFLKACKLSTRCFAIFFRNLWFILS